MQFLPGFTTSLLTKAAICYIEAGRLTEVCSTEPLARCFVAKTFDELAPSLEKKLKEFGPADWFWAFLWCDESQYDPKTQVRAMVDLWVCRRKDPWQKYVEITVYVFKYGGICTEYKGHLSSDTLPVAALELEWYQHLPDQDLYLTGPRPVLPDKCCQHWPHLSADN